MNTASTYNARQTNEDQRECNLASTFLSRESEAYHLILKAAHTNEVRMSRQRHLFGSLQAQATTAMSE